jgi:hypothetical protein
MEFCGWSASTSWNPQGTTTDLGHCPIPFLVSHDFEISTDDLLKDRVDVVRISRDLVEVSFRTDVHHVRLQALASLGFTFVEHGDGE